MEMGWGNSKLIVLFAFRHLTVEQIEQTTWDFARGEITD